MSNPAPPSAPERAKLVAARKRDLPRPKASLQPRVMGADIRSASHEAARERAVNRERRIRTIDTVLSKTSGRANSAFTQSRGSASPAKTATKSASPAKGKSKGQVTRAFTRTR